MEPAKDTDRWMLRVILHHSTLAMEEDEMFWFSVPSTLTPSFVNRDGRVSFSFFKDMDLKAMTNYKQWTTTIRDAQLVKNIKLEFFSQQ